ncbi:caspase family protein [Nostoc sp. CHAB 5836]|uniref:caspase family protein n=1 Tax=Nostoc sp. CHAB 5836 TaxID=2780404 RepID=UPI001E4124D7|nr:caspase family protein [Nostoc sp. CHAB 5836]MCC5618358.1 caspase family protein [Nostoc sp. CHAB 5836]
MKRRTFLHRIGSILAVLGITEAEWLILGNRYYQALAQPSPRKLALLIGINQYPKIPALSGCLTDVELQRELLIHRFGFQGSDILTLTEEQASREFIEAAFWDHLGKQAKLGDVVVFHFSGYGSRVKLETSPDAMQNALVPAKLRKDPQNEKIVNYILEETLLRLLRSLPTDRVTAVLDTSYYAPSTLLGLKIRALQESVEVKLAAEELDFLQQLKTQNLPSTPIVLAATSEPKQSAREGLFSGFSAGLFTYALTQYLWEFTPATTIKVAFSHVENSLFKLGSKQQPALLSSQKNPPRDLKNLSLKRREAWNSPLSLMEKGPLGLGFASSFPDTQLQPDEIIGAEGVVSAIEEDGKTVHLWLAGLPPQVLLYYGVNSRFTLATTEELVLRSRTGLTAKVQISKIEGANPLQVGQLVQEAVRVLPRNINLTIALDTGLERIERVDATSAFAAFPRISTVVAGEKPADYLFAKLQQTPSRYGLFSIGGELILNTAGEVGEAVKLAVQRLAPKLSTLLAAKLWRLTENQGSSRLALKASLEIISDISPRIVMQRETARGFKTETSMKKSVQMGLIASLPTPIVPIGSRIQYRVENQSDRPVYLILLGLNNNHTAIAFYSWETPQEPNIKDTKPLLKEIVIAPGETLTLPQTNGASEWVISGPAYFCEQQLIFSTTSFSTTLAALNTAKYSTPEQSPISPLLNSLDVTQALLQDLHLKTEMNSTAADSYILDVNNWASFSFSFQVV